VNLTNGSSESVNGDEGSGKQPSAVVDEENFSHNRRQQLIEDFRQRAFEIRDDAHAEQVAGNLTESAARSYYRGAVESYILQAQQVLETENIEWRDEYLQGAKLGDLVFQPPDALVKFARENIMRMPPGARIPSQKTVSIIGLKDILQAPSPVSVKFSVVLKTQRGIRQEEDSVSKELPRSVLDSAVQMVDRALDDADLGIKVGEKENQTKITDKHVKEVDQWRREHNL